MMIEKVYIIKIGVPHDESFRIIGFTLSQADAVAEIKRWGYDHYNEKYNYWEMKPKEGFMNNGEWARIQTIENITKPYQ